MNCEICQDSFNLAEKKPLLLLPCCHTYCSECILQLKEPTCPNCRQLIMSTKPNWSFMKLLPESKVDKLKADIKSYLNQTESLKAKFHSQLEQKLDVSKTKITQWNSQIVSKTNELINMMYGIQKNLLNQTEQLSNRLTAHLIDLEEKQSKIEISAKLRFTDRIERFEQLTEKEMINFSKELLLYMNGFTFSLKQIDHADDEYELDAISSLDFKLVKVKYLHKFKCFF